MNPTTRFLTRLPNVDLSTTHLSLRPLAWRSSTIGMVLLYILLFGITGCVTAPDPSAPPAAIGAPDDAIPRPGAASLGDPYYPWMGNSGYDATHYTLDLAVDSIDPPTSTLSSTVTMQATALHPLSTFNLDFLGFEITQLTVNGTPAAYNRTGRELLIIPERPLAWGEPFSVTVAYEGVPEPVFDPALPVSGIGWLTTEGGIYGFNQPSGASTWFPVNDYPLDKATYTFRVTVPEPYVAVANGNLQETLDEDGMTTYVWEMRDFMASYLATVNVGEFVEETEIGPNGLHIRNYFPPDAPPQLLEPFDATAAQIEFFNELLGPYPFTVYGSLLMAIDFPAALETQTIPIYGQTVVAAAGERVLAHELAHQWVGNYVSVEDWQDIWINEGFATYAEWLWLKETQGEAAYAAAVRGNYATFAPTEPTVQLDKETFILQLSSLLSPEITLTPEEVDTILEELLGGSVADNALAAAVADVPAAGIPATELPALIETAPFTETTFTNANFVATLPILGLDELAAQFPARYDPPGRPALGQLFGQSVYQRGGLTFAALNARLGDEIFFEAMRTYIRQYGGGVAGTDELIGVAEAVSGEELTDFFYGWLFAEELPDIPELGLIREDPTTWQPTMTQE